MVSVETEEAEILDNKYKPKKVFVNQFSIEHDVSALLKKGLTTSSAGGFFFIPYLLQLNAHNLLANTGKATFRYTQRKTCPGDEIIIPFWLQSRSPLY